MLYCKEDEATYKADVSVYKRKAQKTSTWHLRGRLQSLSPLQSWEFSKPTVSLKYIHSLLVEFVTFPAAYFGIYVSPAS